MVGSGDGARNAHERPACDRAPLARRGFIQGEGRGERGGSGERVHRDGHSTRSKKTSRHRWSDLVPARFRGDAMARRGDEWDDATDATVASFAAYVNTRVRRWLLRRRRSVQRLAARSPLQQVNALKLLVIVPL